MISVEEIDKAISELESRDATYANCAKLADLYICRDALRSYSVKAEPVDRFGESDFAKTVCGMEQTKVMPVICELMDVLLSLNPGLYEGVMRRLED